MPDLLPRSVFFYHPQWVGPGGRLVWSLLFLTFGLLWVMLLMKHPAIKSWKTGVAIFVLGVGAGVTQIVIGKLTYDTQLVRDTLVPNGWITLWLAAFCGIFTLMMSINASPIKLPFSKRVHVLGTIGLIVVFYLIGGFVHAITVLTTWGMILTLLASITLYIWALPPRVEDATWAEAIAGALFSFLLMAFIYAIVPHEWITFATSYLGFTKDAKVSSGGQFVLNTWLGGDFWTKRTRVIPFEVTFEALQDQATSLIYVIGATLNIKLFVAWQKRNEVVKAKEISEDEESAPSKLSRFGRPLRSLKTSKA